MRKISFLIALLALSPVSFGADASACMGCHAADEFAGLSSADIVADLTDAGIPPHKRFADLSQEEIEAIAAELTGS
jgi:hypothetical protein